MDLKALIAKMTEIENKQVLTESVINETIVKESSIAINEEAEEIVLRSEIAKELLKEFNLEEADEWTPTPEQEKWLGGANRQDPYVIARMPGDKPPLTYFKDPEDQAIAKKLNIGQSNLNAVKSLVGMKPGNAQTFADPTTAKPAAGQAAQPAPSPAGEPVAQDDVTGVDAAVAAQAAANAAPAGQAAQPAGELKPAAVGANADGKEGEAQAAQTFPVREPGKITSTEQPPRGQAAQPANGAEAQGTIDPNKLKRFKELLAKAGAK
jgi:hypothetical protein